MACTREELRRWAGEITRAPSLAFAGDRLDLRPAGVPIAIVARDLPPRRVGLLRLAMLDVRFEYDAPDAGVARKWITLFDAHTQRGGG